MKTTILSILIVVILILGTIFFTRNDNSLNDNINNVNIIDGKQIIEINAKGGYFPRLTSAKAGIPSVIKVNTKSTFDCSSALVIPNLGYRNYLPQSGETFIDVPPQKAGTKLQGLCSMGMYNFSIDFN